VTIPSLGLRAYPASSRTSLAFVILALGAVFLPVLIVPYAFSDDYVILSMADGLGSSPWVGSDILHAAAVNGRPLQGLFINSLFPAAGTLDDLRLVRLVSVVGILVLAFLIHWALVRSGIKPSVAALITILICSLPSFEVYGAWGVLFSSPYAAILGACASLLAVSAVDSERGLVVDRMIGATVLLMAALLTYQPAAMFFWVFLAIALIGASSDLRRALRLLRMHLGIGFVGLALGFVVVKIGAHWAGPAAPNAARNTLTHNVIVKARWFVKTAVYQSLNLVDLTPEIWLAIVVAVVALVGVGLLLRNHHSPQPLVFMLIGVCLIPLCYIPNLVVREDVAFYRTQSAMTSLIALYACLGVVGFWVTVRDWLRARVTGTSLAAWGYGAAVVSCAAVAVSVVVAASNVLTYFIEPQSTELRLLRSQIAATPTGAARIAFVQTGEQQGMTKVVRYDEFGLPSSAQPWVPVPAVMLILREEGRLDASRPPAVDILPWYTTTLPATEPHVDVRDLQLLR
jgi:hypothetical protein